MKLLYIVRGLPGSGKTTLAHKLDAEVAVHSADDYFTDEDGNYNFNPSELYEAHSTCLDNVLFDMESEVPTIAVANTFSQAWEAEPYFRIAKQNNYSTFVIECQNDFGNVHGVPEESIAAMKERWESIRTLDSVKKND